jgi:hypothetical protein
MVKNRSFRFIVFILLIGMIAGPACQKFVNKKPSTTLVVPTTLDDFQALLDNDLIMRECPALGELSTDDFYLLYPYWSTLNNKEHNAYTWAQDIYQGQGGVEDWDLPYQQVFYANVVMEGLAGITKDSSNTAGWNALEGAAYFIRAYAFYNLAQVFAPVYDGTKSPTDPYGIPLRLVSDVNAVSIRSTVQHTYDRILSDLNMASGLLPVAIPFANRNRPSKPAALAMMARVYLSMRDYGNAGKYADSCLKMYDSLIDYNTVSTSSFFPFAKGNPETMYQSRLLSSTQVFLGFANASCIVDSALFQSYDTSDLRRSIFYTVNSSGNPNCKGTYNGGVFPFSGLAIDEVYLVRAESYARMSNTILALNDLDSLLVKRWMAGSFVPLSASSPAQALSLVLAERRKELAFRGTRWSDLRRLNQEGAAIGLSRNLNGQSYSLLPGGLNYVLPIPPDVIQLSGIMQNPR